MFEKQPAYAYAIRGYSGHMPAPDFEKAARRHFLDALLLESSGRLPNADHLSGFAAECALKALVELYLGGKVMGDFVHWNASGGKIQDHLGKKLWNEVAALANARSAPNEILVLLSEDPFSDWNVAERYTNGERISAESVANHINGAKKVLSALESYRLANMTGVAL